MKISKILGALLVVGAMGLVAAPAFAAEPVVREVGNCDELTLQASMAGNGDTVLLTDDIVCADTVRIYGDIILDLANYNLTFIKDEENNPSGDPLFGVWSKQGSVKIVGSGKIANTVEDGIGLTILSKDSEDVHFLIGEGVTIEGETAICLIDPPVPYHFGESGTVIDLYGTIKSTKGYSIEIVGTNWDSNVVNVKNTAKIIAPMEKTEAISPAAIKASGYAEWIFEDGAEISGYNGVVADMGSFEVYGAKVNTTKEVFAFLSGGTLNPYVGDIHPNGISLFINHGEFRSAESVIVSESIVNGDTHVQDFTIYGGDFYSGEEGKIFDFSDGLMELARDDGRWFAIFGGDYNFPLAADFLQYGNRQTMFLWNGMYKVVGVLKNIEKSMIEGLKAGMEVGQQIDYGWGITKFAVVGEEIGKMSLEELIAEKVSEKSAEDFKNSNMFTMYDMYLLSEDEEPADVDDMETFIFIPASEIKGEYDHYRMRYVEFDIVDDKMEFDLTDETHDCTEMEDGSYVCPLYHFSVYGLEGYNDEVFVPAAPDTSAAGETTFVAVMLTIVFAIFATVGVGVAVNKRG